MSADRVCEVLREDAELAEAIAPERRSRAIRECTARELLVAQRTASDRAASATEGGIGLLVLEGLLVRRVGVDGRFGAELLGRGDLLRPWQSAHDSVLALQTDWNVVEPARLAVLDERFARHLSRYPELAGALVARAIQRSRHLAVNMAIVHQARVDLRLHMLLWHLAGRWGRVRGDGTVLPFRLTHAVLADLVAARRPTVTSALADLTRRGLVRSYHEHWLLTGAPPAELLDLEAQGGARRRRESSRAPHAPHAPRPAPRHAPRPAPRQRRAAGALAAGRQSSSSDS